MPRSNSEAVSVYNGTMSKMPWVASFLNEITSRVLREMDLISRAEFEERIARLEADVKTVREKFSKQR